MRILSLDLGEKRIGVAVSDPLGFTAQGLDTLVGQTKEQVLARLKDICKEYKVVELVVGLPRNMNGTLGPKAEHTMRWVSLLEKELSIPVVTWDERLTSKEAGRLMIEEGLSRSKQRASSDRLAATLILQNYLEFKRIQKDKNEKRI